MTRVTLGKSRVRESCTPGSVRAKAEWLSYSTVTEAAPAAPVPEPAGVSSAGPADVRARQALGHYEQAIDRLKAGDWAGFGAELDALRPLLEQLGRQPTTH